MLKAILLALLILPVKILSQDTKSDYEQGKKAYDEGRYTDAIRLNEQALAEVRMKEPGGDLHSRILNNLGIAYIANGNYQQAILFLEEKIKLEEKLNSNPSRHASAHSNLAHAYEASGNISAALPHFIAAVESMKTQVDPSDKSFISMLFHTADIAFNLKEYEVCEKYFKEVLALNLPLSSDQLRYINEGIGMSYYYLQEYENAEEYLITTTALYDKLYGRKDVKFLTVLNKLGANYFGAGYYGKAEECYREVYNTTKDMDQPNNETLASAANNMGTIYTSYNDYSKAWEYFREALSIKAKIYSKEDPKYLTGLMNLAALYIKAGLSKEGLKTEQEVSAILASVPDPDPQVLMINQINMAASMVELGQAKAAEVEYGKVLARDPANYSALSSMGMVKRSQNKLSESETYFIKALAAAERNTPAKITQAIWELAKIYQQQKGWEKSQQYYTRAIDRTLTDLVKDFIYQTEEEKLAYLANNLKSANDFMMHSVDEYQHGRPMLTRKALEYEMYMRGIVLNSMVELRKWIEIHGTNEQKQYYERWNSIKAFLGNSALQIIHESDVEIHGGDQIQRLVNRMEKKMIGSLAATMQLPARISMDQLAGTLKDGEAAVEIMRLSTGDTTNTIHYIAMIVTNKMKDHPEVIMLGTETLEKKYLPYYQNSIKAHIIDTISYVQFWKPVQQKLESLKVNRIYLAADGVYHKVNINTLYDTDTKTYSLDKVKVNYVTSCADILQAGVLKPTKTALLVGNPLYGKVERDAEKRGTVFALLPGTETEIVAVSKLMTDNRWKVETYLQGAAKEGVIKKAQSPDVLHIATHGFFVGETYAEKINVKNENIQRTSNYEEFSGSDKMILQNDRMLRSGLIFAGANDMLLETPDMSNIMKNDDGYLTAFEASSLNLSNTQLVVLSACSTGLGDAVAYEGVFGLQRAFRLAGARNIMMSLWEVSDEATSELMIAFYKEWFRTGNLTESFATAQQQLRKKYVHPYYWGSFVLVGK